MVEMILVILRRSLEGAEAALAGLAKLLGKRGFYPASPEDTHRQPDGTRGWF